MELASDPQEAKAVDGAELRGLTAALREKKSAVVGPERRKVAEEAVEELKEFAQRVDDKSVAARALCLAAEETEDELHDSKGAAELFESALRLNPFLERAAQQADALLQRLGRHPSRIELLRHRATTLDGTKGASDAVRAAAWRQAAHVVRKWGDDPLDGIPLYEKATSLDPEVDSLDALADLYTLRGDPGDEEQAADIYTSIAEALDGAEAIDYAGRALDLLPDHQDAMALLENLVPAAQHGRVLRRRLLDYITRAGDDEDADPRRIHLARVFAEEGKLKEGVACLAPAVSRKNTEAVALREELLEALRVGNLQRRGTSTLVGVPVHYAVSDTQAETPSETTEDDAPVQASSIEEEAEPSQADAPAKTQPVTSPVTRQPGQTDDASEEQVEPSRAPEPDTKPELQAAEPTEHRMAPEEASALAPAARQKTAAEAAQTSSIRKTASIEVRGRDSEPAPPPMERPERATRSDKPHRPPPPPARHTQPSGDANRAAGTDDLQASARMETSPEPVRVEPDRTAYQIRSESVPREPSRSTHLTRSEPVRGEWSTPNRTPTAERLTPPTRTRRPSPPPRAPGRGRAPDELGDDEVEVEVEVEHEVNRPSLVITPVEPPPETRADDEEDEASPRREHSKTKHHGKRRTKRSVPPQPAIQRQQRPSLAAAVPPQAAPVAASHRVAQPDTMGYGHPSNGATMHAATATAHTDVYKGSRSQRVNHALVDDDAPPRLDPNAGLSLSATAPTFPAPMPRQRSSSSRYLLWIAGLLGAAAAVVFYFRRPAPTWSDGRASVKPKVALSQPQPEPAPAPTTDKNAAKVGGSVAFRDQTTRLSGSELNREAFFAELKSLEPELTECYRTALDRRPGLEGYLVYGLMLSRGKGKGDTRMLGDPRGSLRDNQLARCVSQLLQDAQWPKPGAGQTRVRLPLYFYP